MRNGSVLVACLLAVGFAGIAPAADAASAKKSKSRDSARSHVLEGKHRGRGPRIRLPIGPSYIYYDYPYYYSRGHYPTHIGGYIYYIPRASGRCTTRRCAGKPGYHRARASTRRQREGW